MKKKVLVGIIIIFILLICLSIVGLIFLDIRDKNISLIKDKAIIEYGNTYNPKIEELIDLSKYNFINLEDIRIENNIENEKDKEYPAVGGYEISIYYKDIKLKQTVEILDTVAPEISIQDKIKVEYNTDLATIDFEKYISISDLSETKKYEIDLSNIKSDVSGEYETSIFIQDIYGNKSEGKLKIEVLEKVEETVEQVVKETMKITQNKNNNINKVNVSTTKENTDKVSNSNNMQTPTDTKVEENTQTTNETNKKQEVIENKTNEESPKCTHSNENWYNSKSEAEAIYYAEIKKWGDKWANYEIELDEYSVKCPDGYEVFSCPYCNRWTINLYY